MTTMLPTQTDTTSTQAAELEPDQIQARPESRLLQYLPAIFQIPPDTGKEPFLGQLLRPFEQVWSEFDELLETIDRYFGPALTPAEDFLPWLATWVALTLDEDWEEGKEDEQRKLLAEDRRRRLLAEAVELYRWRGTIHGLKRYLEIFTGLPQEAIEIHEAAWPGGMQIGIASQIGVVSPKANSDSGDVSSRRIMWVDAHDPVANYDYLVVSTSTCPPEHSGAGSCRYYHRTDRVQRLEFEDSHVTVHRQGEESPGTYDNASVERRNYLPDRRYTLHRDSTDAPQVYLFRGDTRLVAESEPPYCFVVQIRAKPQEIEMLRQKGKLAKLRAILEQEKPAHTRYYLRLDPTAPAAAHRFMQIEVRSRIGVDTIPS